MLIAPEKIKLTDTCLNLPGISWEKFEQIAITFTDVQGVRFVYLDGELEIMILGTEHEYYKRTISLLLEAYLRTTNIRFYSGGSTTLGNKTITGRKEPDESYNFYSQKNIPDLVIEVIVSSGNINILEIYRRIGIPEVWFYQDSILTVHVLQEGQYLKADHSQLLPELTLEAFAKYINYPDQYDAVTEFVNGFSNYSCHSSG